MGLNECSSPPWPEAAALGTFIVARMLCRSLSWMGWVGLATDMGAAGVWAAGVVGVTVGEVAAGAKSAGVTGVVVAWAELLLRAPPEPEDGVAAADWLRELARGEEGGGQHRSLIKH